MSERQIVIATKRSKTIYGTWKSSGFYGTLTNASYLIVAIANTESIYSSTYILT
jgi:hypothetical protein